MLFASVFISFGTLAMKGEGQLDEAGDKFWRKVPAQRVVVLKHELMSVFKVWH